MRVLTRFLIAGAGLLALAVPSVSAAAGPPDPSIIGGQPASENYSFVASFQTRSGSPWCGGSLIRADWVLTAKHCMAGETPASVQIRIGSTNRSSGGTLAFADRWVDHPGTDLSVVHLTTAVSQQPVQVAGSAPVGAAIRLLGWGCTTDPNCGPSPVTLQQLDTSILADSRCGVGADMICVNNPDGSRGACYGDSGGPAVLGTAGNWQLVGATHGGTSSICGQGPSTYADVPAARAWIDSTVGGGTSTNLALNRPATGSASCNADEGPAKAVNGSVGGGVTDKWCSGAAGTKTLQVDLGATRTIRTVTVRHAGAGGESASFNTRDFDLQVSNDGNTWTTAAQARASTASVTNHAVTASGRYVRLSVIAATQTTSGVARIYELEVYA
jgi:hypothetical protein